MRALADIAAPPEIAEPGRNHSADSTAGPSAGPPRSKLSLLVLGLVAVLYLGLSCHLLMAQFAATGTLTYPLDDTYISMAIAKNFALHGIWGIAPWHRFVSATSCPGFVLLLAGLYRLTGPTVWWPLALSLTFGLLALVAAWHLLRETHLAVQAAALAGIVVFTPLPVLGVMGMEHTLHIFLVLTFLHATGTAIARRKALSWPAMLLTAAMVSTRYESLFLVAIAGLLYLAQRQIRPAFFLGVAAAAPVAIYGLVSVLHGGYWLPNTLALKGAAVSSLARAPLDLANHFSACLFLASYMGALVAAILALLALPAIRRDGRVRSILVMVLGATLIHLTLADVGWLYRYEAYLIAGAIAAIALGLSHLRISRDHWPTAAIVLLGAVSVWMLSGRALQAQLHLPQHSAAIFSQQIQMARFLARYEPGAVVAANDIGAISYFADIKCLDLVGLADPDVFRLKRSGAYTTAAMKTLAAERGVQVAVVYDSRFLSVPGSLFWGPALPPSWIRVAQWRTPYGNLLGSELVSFYAMDPAAAERLRQSLAAFTPSLPPGVEVPSTN